MDFAHTSRVPHRSTGLIIGIGAALSVFLMMHHPSIQTRSVADAVVEIGDKAVINRLVHGGLIGLMILVFVGLIGFAEYLGWSLARVRAGVVFYFIGVACMIGAALMNGFVVTGIAATYAAQPGDVLETLKPIFVLCHELNQTLAQAGTVALSIAIFAWSLVLLGRGTAARVIGVLGLLVSAIPIAGLLSGYMQLDLHGMSLIVVAQAIWNVCVALWCWTRHRTDRCLALP